MTRKLKITLTPHQLQVLRREAEDMEEDVREPERLVWGKIARAAREALRFGGYLEQPAGRPYRD